MQITVGGVDITIYEVYRWIKAGESVYIYATQYGLQTKEFDTFKKAYSEFKNCIDHAAAGEFDLFDHEGE